MRHEGRVALHHKGHIRGPKTLLYFLRTKTCFNHTALLEKYDEIVRIIVKLERARLCNSKNLPCVGKFVEVFFYKLTIRFYKLVLKFYKLDLKLYKVEKRGYYGYCMARSLCSLHQVAILRHGHMARRSVSHRSCIQGPRVCEVAHYVIVNSSRCAAHNLNKFDCFLFQFVTYMFFGKRPKPH